MSIEEAQRLLNAALARSKICNKPLLTLEKIKGRAEYRLTYARCVWVATGRPKGDEELIDWALRVCAEQGLHLPRPRGPGSPGGRRMPSGPVLPGGIR